jgi:kinesin family protein C1
VSATLRQRDEELRCTNLELQQVKMDKVVIETNLKNLQGELKRLQRENRLLVESGGKGFQKIAELQEKMNKKDQESQEQLNKFMDAKNTAESRLGEAHARSNAQLQDIAELQVLKAQLEQKLEDAHARLRDTEKVIEDSTKIRDKASHSEGIISALKDDLEATRRSEVELRAELDAFLRARPDVSGATEVQSQVKDQVSAALKEFDVVNAQEKLQEREKELAELRSEFQRAELQWDEQRRALHNQIAELKGNIRVFARIRPITLEETEEGERALLANSANPIVTVREGVAPQAHEFQFDGVFDEGTNQEKVFSEVSHMVQSSLDGYNVCLMSYGQTGSGKTYTMFGNADDMQQRGIVPRAVEQVVLCAISKADKGWNCAFEASCLEIYKENVRDLLCPSGSSGNLDVKHSEEGATSITNLTSLPFTSSAQVRSMLRTAERHRSTAETDMNEHSSRSHSIFWIKVYMKHSGIRQEMKGNLFLIDLAGSERLSRSNATGDRMAETQAINKSLSALGDVFTALNKKQSHIPYRNSKLTWLLQPCLSGHGKCMLMLNLSPSVLSAQESICSLRFGSMVHQTELGKAKRNFSSTQPTPTSLQRTPSKASGLGTPNKPAPFRRANTTLGPGRSLDWN